MSEIGEMLTKEDTYLWSENDIFGYTITFSLKFEDFDELIFLNSFAPSFSTKRFDEDIYEGLLS